MGQNQESHTSRAHFSNPVLNAVINVNMAASFLQARVNEACTPLGITGVQYSILRILQRSDNSGLSRNDIVRQIIEKSVDVTRSIDGLVKLGYVEREPSANDRRMVLHRITEQGNTALHSIDPNFRTMLNAIGSAFTSDELTVLSSLCEKIYAQEVTSL